MTSQINTSNIDILYPIAGQDNNSQGFRDNFAAIQEGLATAATEITALQTNSVQIANSSNQPVVNNLLGSTISNGIYNKFYGAAYSVGTITTAANIDLSNGPIQAVTLTENATLTFVNWPAAGQWGAVRVHVSSNLSGVFSPTFATANAGTIKYDTHYPTAPIGIITVSATSSGTNLITVSSTSTLSANLAITFSGSVGNLVAGAIYYVLAVNNSTTFTVSTSAGGSVFGLVSATAIGEITVQPALTSTPGFTVGGESLAGVTVITTGSGYTTPATIAVSGGSPLTNYTLPTLIATYQIVSATPSGGSAGTGYAVGDILVLNTNPNVTFTVASITGNGSTGPINAVNVTTNGGPLLSPVFGVKSVTAVTGTGSGARLTLVSGLFGITMENPGNGYTTITPTITISGSGGVDGTAVATLTSGKSGHAKVIEAWTIDGGATVFIRYMGEY
jgi:hypothetical protein